MDLVHSYTSFALRCFIILGFQVRSQAPPILLRHRFSPRFLRGLGHTVYTVHASSLLSISTARREPDPSWG